MKVNYVSTPFIFSFQLFKDFPFDKVKEQKCVTVRTSFAYNSKTRISIDFLADESLLSADIVPEGSKKYKFDQAPRRPVFWFKLTKKQGLTEFEDHLQNVVAERLGIDRDSDFEIHVQKTSPIFQLAQVTDARKKSA